MLLLPDLTLPKAAPFPGPPAEGSGDAEHENLGEARLRHDDAKPEPIWVPHLERHHWPGCDSANATTRAAALLVALATISRALEAAESPLPVRALLMRTFGLR